MFHSLLDLTVDIFGGSIDPEAGAELATGISSTSAGGPGEAISPQTERVGKGLRRCQFPEQFGSSEQGGFRLSTFSSRGAPSRITGKAERASRFCSVDGWWKGLSTMDGGWHYLNIVELAREVCGSGRGVGNIGKEWGATDNDASGRARCCAANQRGFFIALIFCQD